MRRSPNYKLFIVSLTLALLFLIVGANVFIVSVFGYHINSGANLHNEINGIHEVEKNLYANRGQISDRNGTVLAQDVASYTLYASLDTSLLKSDQSPAHVVDKETTAQAISEIIGMDYDRALEILNSEAMQVEFGAQGKYLTLSQKNALIERELPGIGFTDIVSRNYPLAPFAPNILGFSRFNEQTDQQEGQLGIELLYNEELSGRDGYEKFQQDSLGYVLKQDNAQKILPEDGKNIKLTLDRGIQETLENAMAGMSSDDKVKAKEVWGAVVEVKTGRILGWAEYPAFDPNDPDTNWNSRGVEYTFEPGSTMKTFTIAAAIDQGVYNGQETFYSGPFYAGIKNNDIVRLPTSAGSIHTITNAQNVNYGDMTYDYGYAMSSNVMIAELLTKHLNKEKFHEYLLSLGFFRPVNMDRIQDQAGIDLWDHPLEKLTNGFGQGSTVTMLQMVQAYTTVLGNGTLIKPYLVDEIVNPATNEVEYKGQTIYGDKVFKDTTAKAVRDNMREVVTEGSAMRFDVEEVEMIAKTGTAEYVDPVEGGYSKTEYIFSSILAFPYEEPEVMIYTAYRANMGHSLSSQVNYVKDVVKKVVSTYEFDRENDPGYVEQTVVNTVHNVTNLGLSQAQESLKEKGYNVIVVGDGSRVIKQYPESGTKLISKEHVLLYTSDDGIIMPDMTSWSYKQVSDYRSFTGLNINLSGRGFVSSQSVEVGSLIDKETEITIVLD